MTAQRVTIERLVAGGDALAHLEDGRVVFVEGALPGEVVDVEITQSKKDFARASLTSIVTPSPHRVEPPCPNVARGCGGCSWQHLDHDRHARTKIDLVTEALRRTAHLEGIEVGFGGSLPPSASRTTLRMAVDKTVASGFASRTRTTSSGSRTASLPIRSSSICSPMPASRVRAK